MVCLPDTSAITQHKSSTTIVIILFYYKKYASMSYGLIMAHPVFRPLFPMNFRNYGYYNLQTCCHCMVVADGDI